MLWLLGLPSPHATGCWSTTIGAKCGTDVVISHQDCGGSLCKTEEWIYETQLTCSAAPVGFHECEAVWCRKITIKRKCENNACVLDGDPQYSNILEGTKARGASGLCPS